MVERLFPHSQTREYRAPEEVFVRSVSRYDFETADKRGDEFRFRRSYFLISANAEFLGLRMKQLEDLKIQTILAPEKGDHIGTLPAYGSLDSKWEQARAACSDLGLTFPKWLNLLGYRSLTTKVAGLVHHLE